ncbi:MAG: PilZ domain-containing protein [Phycisphaeraceae bacterium]
MLEENELKLVRDEHLDGDPIPLERRIDHRKPTHGRVTALLTMTEEEPRRNRICSLELRDVSEGGLGTVSAEELPRGATITVFFPPHGPERGFDMYGKVAWCRPCDDGYEIGLEVARQTAACA